MKKWYFLLVLFLLICPVAFSQVKFSKKNNQEATGQPVHQYWFVLLTAGTGLNVDSATNTVVFSKHMANIARLYQKGILKAAGPFGDNSNNWREMFILDCKTRVDAESLVKADPAIAAGILKADITPWFTTPVDSFKPGPPQTEDEQHSVFE